jgi:hypothetical protein
MIVKISKKAKLLLLTNRFSLFASIVNFVSEQTTPVSTDFFSDDTGIRLLAVVSFERDAFSSGVGFRRDVSSLSGSVDLGEFGLLSLPADES